MEEEDPLNILLSKKEPDIDCKTCGKSVSKNEWDNCTRRKMTDKVKNLNPFKNLFKSDKKSHYKEIITKTASRKRG